MSEPEQAQKGWVSEADHKAYIIAAVCAELGADQVESAVGILQRRYPFEALKNAGRHYSTLQSIKIFIRDGFTDRYSGLPLIFPGALRTISLRPPKDFPFHPNWKTDQCHFAYWELLPTVDHVIPVSRGGADNDTNWVTTSMVKNAANANFCLEEIGWQLFPREPKDDWDGLTSWFSGELARNPSLSNDSYVRKWAGALRTIAATEKVAAEGSLGE